MFSGVGMYLYICIKDMVKTKIAKVYHLKVFSNEIFFSKKTNLYKIVVIKLNVDSKMFSLINFSLSNAQRVPVRR